MSTPFKVFGILAVAVAGVYAVYGIALLVYYWFFGVIEGLQHVVALPGAIYAIFIILAFVLVGQLASFIFACIGIWAGITLLGWAWYLAIALYATWFAIVIIMISAGGLITLGAGFMIMLNEMFRSR